MRNLAILVTMLAAAAPAAANVVSATANGLEVREVVPLVVTPAVAFDAFAQLPSWWDPVHTYSGKAENLSFEPVIGGCWCERFPDGGGIEHMRVVHVDPGKRIVMTGSLGPALYEATTGVMDVTMKPAAGGSQLTIDYRLSGFFNGGADKAAPQIDQVLAQQAKRFRAFVAARPKS